MYDYCEVKHTIQMLNELNDRLCYYGNKPAFFICPCEGLDCIRKVFQFVCCCFSCVVEEFLLALAFSGRKRRSLTFSKDVSLLFFSQKLRHIGRDCSTIIPDFFSFSAIFCCHQQTSSSRVTLNSSRSSTTDKFSTLLAVGE